MREKLLKLLKENVPGVNFEAETALVDDGILESMDIVMVVTEIMAAFDVELSVDDLVPENFNSVDSMVAMLEEKLG